MARDYYEVLGVSRDATKNDIKKAFRTLAREYHPDVSSHPDAESRFKEIGEAYEVLFDDDKRARYDRFGHAGVQGPGGGGPGFSGVDIEDIFADFFSSFGGRRAGGRSNGPRPGADRKVEVSISFEESVFGVEKDIEVLRYDTCEDCNGNGAEPGTKTITCPECKGAGEVRQVQDTFLGKMVRVASCPRCNGRGNIVETPCRSCNGNGRKQNKVSIAVNIPAGVRDGLQIQVRGEGDSGEANAPKGNLYVVLNVKEHEFFKLRNNDIILDINVNVAQAAIGDKIKVPTVDGDVELTIPAGTQTGKAFRLRGKGIPRLRSDGSHSGRGDQLVYVQVAIPTELSDEQRHLFEQLALTLGTEIQPQNNGRGFFDRVMDFFAGEQN